MRIDKGTVDRWKKYADLYVRERGHVLEDVTSSGQAWDIAFTLDIPQEAYHMGNGINDNHIDTALRKIFPNVNQKTIRGKI